jgi:hypothetical protein
MVLALITVLTLLLVFSVAMEAAVTANKEKHPLVAAAAGAR